MKTLKTEIIIDASTKTVWDILMDHEAYSKWNPFIKSIEGEKSVGDQLKVSLLQENNKEMEFKPIVLNNEKEKEFRWLGHLFVKGLFDGEHYFLLEEISQEQTRFTHGEKFTGMLSSLLLKMIGDDTKKGFEKMNKALKLKAEQL